MDKCDATTILKTNRLKLTPPRLAILGELLKTERLVNAHELHSKLNPRVSLDLVTVYRTLKTFAEKKITRECYDPAGVQYVELACIHHPVHPHFTCRACAKLFCLGALDMSETRPLTNRAGSFIVETLSINLTGFCDRCRKQRKRDKNDD